MTREVLLAVDAGTTTIKAVVFDADGAERAIATRESTLSRPEPGHVECEMGAVWELTAETIREALASLPDGTEPRGIALTGQGDGLWPITAAGEPARNAICWSDSRAAGIVTEWEEEGILERIVERCGSAPYPGMSLPLLSWLAREEPGTVDRIGTILSCSDWLAYRLTGERTTDHPETTVPYLDRETGEYDRDVFDLVGVPGLRGVLPRLSGATEVVGRVTGEAAAETGLAEGLPVVSAPFDVPASAIGSGAVRPGDAAVTLGTSLTHQLIVDGPRETTGGIQMSLGIDDRWTYAIGSNAGTPTLEWAAELLGAELPALEGLAREAPVGAAGICYQPYLSTSGERGPFVDPHARGGFVGLTPEHDETHLARAVYEGLSLAVRDCVDALPTSPTSVAVSGGGTRSSLWCQLVADCLSRPVVVPAGEQLGARGAAICLEVALGSYPSIAEAVDDWCAVETRYDPRPEPAAAYDELYELYVTVRETMAPIWERRTATYERLDGTEYW